MAEEQKKAGDLKKQNRTKGKKQSWSKGLKTEFGKIIWTDKRTLVRQAAAVLGISVVVCLLITLVDSVGLQIMELIIG